MKVEWISKWIGLYYTWSGASLVAQMLKNFACNVGWETQVQSLGWEDPLEKGIETHSSILAWRIPWTEEPGGLQSMGLQRVGHDWVTNTFTSHIVQYLALRWKPHLTQRYPYLRKKFDQFQHIHFLFGPIWKLWFRMYILIHRDKQ